MDLWLVGGPTWPLASPCGAINLLPVTSSLFAHILPTQATVTLLENIDILVLKTDKADFRADIVPMICNAFDSTTPQIQVRRS